MSHTSVFIGIAAVLVSIVVAVTSALRAQYERVINVVDYISSDEVRKARHQMGLIIHRSQAPATDVERDARVDDLFVVLWAFQRVDAVQRSLPGVYARWFFQCGPNALLKTTVRPWVLYWHGNIDEILRLLSNPDIDASREGLDRLHVDWNPRSSAS